MTAIPTEERTIDRKARMKLPFEDLRTRPAGERLKDFDATFYPLTEDEARRGAEGCTPGPEGPLVAPRPPDQLVARILGAVLPARGLVSGIVRARQGGRAGAHRRVGGLCHGLPAR